MFLCKSYSNTDKYMLERIIYLEFTMKQSQYQYSRHVLLLIKTQLKFFSTISRIIRLGKERSKSLTSL